MVAWLQGAELLRRSFLERRHFSSLDGLRALSIVPVVWHHATPVPLPGLLGRGPIGVDLFFAISGFLITTLLLRERAQLGRIDLTAFYARRSFRIFPLYYLVFALHVLFARHVRPEWEPSRNFLAQAHFYATYTANWSMHLGQAGPALFVFAWSLCTEEQFYGFWAPVLRYSRTLSVAAGLMLAWVLVDLGLETGWLGAEGWRQSLPYAIATSFAAPIGLGALSAMAVHDAKLGPWLLCAVGRRHSSTALLALTSSLIAVPWAGPFVLHLLLALLVVSCSVRSDHGLAGWLDHTAARAIGRISYGIYLWHVPVIGLVRAVAPPLREQPSVVFAIALPLSVALAALSFRLYEQRFLEMGASFRRSRDGSSAVLRSQRESV